MSSLWSRIVHVFGLFSLSPGDLAVWEQRPLTGHDASLRVGDDGHYGDGPKFHPPAAPSWSDIECDYSSMIGYKKCSTDGDRSCWLTSTTDSNHFNIETDYENLYPTGTTRQIYLEIDDKTIAPDGVDREAQIINGTYPGPWIQACWGDDLEITVKNNMNKTGTTIHWHGIRMLHSNANDGVNAITQCPTPPGETFTYKFKAMQYGTTWYHSHHTLQYGEGVLGPLTIHGPSSADWDEAKPPVMMSDWSHTPLAKEWNDTLHGDKTARKLDSILVNGTGEFEGSSPYEKYTLHFKKGRRYLLRLINTSVDTAFVFAIDNHKIQVISADLVPIVPYMADHVVVGIGQRYHVVIAANPIDGAHDGNYWMRTIPAAGCSPSALQQLNNRTGIIRYANDTADPVFDRTYNNTCRDEPYDKLVPTLHWQVGDPSNFASESQFDIGLDPTQGEPFYLPETSQLRWSMYSDTMWLNFSKPSLAHLEENYKNWERHTVVVSMNQTHDDWVYLLVSGTGIPREGRLHPRTYHPIHLHGHDFAILEQSRSPYRIGHLNLNLDNPPRRDVAFLPEGGYLVLAFKADNPGAWLMHCHIAWHASGGLALQILENVKDIKLNEFDQHQLDRTCEAWIAWNETNHFVQEDSGI